MDYDGLLGSFSMALNDERDRVGPARSVKGLMKRS